MNSVSGIRFRAVMAVTFFIMFGYGMIVPTLPLFASTLGVAETGVGLVFTVFAGARLAGSLFAGSLVERRGERQMAAIGAFIVGASSFAAGFSWTFAALVVLRGLGGVGSAFFLAALLSGLLGAVPADRRARVMALFWAVVGVGFILGPVFGGLAATISLRTPLFVYGAICMVAAPLVYVVLAPSREHAAGDVSGVADAGALPDQAAPVTVPAWRKLRPLLADPAYRAALAVGAASFFVIGGVDPLIAQVWRFSFELSESSVGIPFMLAGIATLLPAWHSGKLGDTRGRKFATLPALLVSALGIGSLGFFSSPVAFAAMFTLVGLTWGYQRSGPSAIVGDVSNNENRAIAVGGFRIATDVGALLGPIVVGAAGEHAGHSTAFLIAAGVVVLAFLALLPVRETAPAVAGDPREPSPETAPKPQAESA